MKQLVFIFSLCLAAAINTSDNEDKRFTSKEWTKIRTQGELFKDPKYVSGFYIFSGLEAYKKGDLNMAEFFFEKGAAFGNPRGAYLKASLVEDKRDCPLHLNVALRWYKMAAKKGHDEAKIAVNRLSSYKTKNFTKCSCKL